MADGGETLYPGPVPSGSESLSFASIRMEGGGSPFWVDGCIRLVATEDILGIGLTGGTSAALLEIAIPRHAITSCEEAGLVHSSQELRVIGCSVRIMFYGRGARFVRAWWEGELS
jgi:hypothetical protein